jgi:hypothetical protein
MKKLLLGLVAAAMLAGPAFAQNQNVRIIGRGSDGIDRPVLATDDGKLQVSGGTAGTAASPSSSVTTVQGTAPAGSTATGNPVGIGCVYNTNLPTLTDGQRGNCQLGTRGALGFQLMAPDSATAVTVVTTPNDTGANTGMNALQVYAANRLYDATGTQWVRARGDASGQWAVSRGGGTLATGQVSVGTSATLIAAARTGRQKIGVTVTTAVQCAFGNPGVTLTTGWPLAAVAYASDSWDTTAALYGVCASTATVGFREQY